MKRARSITSVVLTVIMLISIFTIVPISASAAGGVESKIQQIKNVYPTGSYFTKSGNVCYSNQSADCELNNIPSRGGLPSGASAASVTGNAWSCCSFARYIFYTVFGISPEASTPVSSSNLSFGDYIRIRSGEYKHYAILLGQDNDYWYVYNSNGTTTPTNIVEYSQRYSKSKWSLMAAYHATNYDTINGGNQISYSVDLNDGQSIRGTGFPITGNVKSGGTYPWLHLYVDYAWVADTANNSVGNYAFYLDTTKYSNGEHLIGVKITNQDGVDYTTWRKVIIDNENPVISTIYLSQQSNSGYRVCIPASDNIGVSVARVATWTKEDRSDLVWNNCRYNGAGTYFIDLKRSDFAQGATQYYNHAYVYDAAGNYDVKVITMTYDESYSLVKSIYYSEIKKDTFRICCEVNNNEEISKVRVATWATGDMSDLIWFDCNYNGNGTYFKDLNRSDYAKNALTYINHVYVYDKNGKHEEHERRIVYEENPPVISDIVISNVSEQGFSISCNVDDESNLKSVEFPTWLASDSTQADLKWHKATVKDGTASCYIPLSDHNNKVDIYYLHIYAYDFFGNLGTARVTIDMPSYISSSQEEPEPTDIPTEPVTTENTEPTLTNPTEPLTTEPTTDNFTEPVEPISDIPTEPITTEPQTDNPTEPTQPITNAPKTTSKKTNPVKVSVKPKTVKLKKIKKKAQKVKAITVKKAQGKVTYKLIKNGITKKICKLVKINSKGVITIKRWKKAKKGTYKIKVQITVKGNSKYKPKTVNKVVKVKIK